MELALAHEFPLAVAVGELTSTLGSILYFIMLPMLLLMALGFILQKRIGLHSQTLTKLSFYAVIPGTVYYSIVHSQIGVGEVGKIVFFTLAVMACLGGFTLLVAMVRRVPRDQVNAMIATTIFYNSGNYGLPLQEWAYRGLSFQRNFNYSDVAVGYQTIVMMVQNVSNFSVGVFLAASGKRDRHWKQNLLSIVKFPPMYALAAALLTVQIRGWLGPAKSFDLAQMLQPFWDVIKLLRDSFVPVALLTLGIQLAQVKRDGVKYPVKLSVFTRLLIGPAIGFAMVWLMGLQGLLAQVMLIGTASPTAVNAMLICLEFDNHPDYMARAVFYSSLLSPVVGAVVIFLAQGDFWPWFVIPGF